MPHHHDTFLSPCWLPTGHIQTIYPVLFSKRYNLTYRRERWELADGDFIDIDWVDSESQDAHTKPVVVLFHGLEGSSQSHYSKALMAEVKAKGWRGVVMHFRGCSGEPNRLPRAYFAGDTEEIERMLNHVKQQAQGAQVFAVGVSLGGNALLKWMGEKGTHALQMISKAAAISAPMDLAAVATSLDSGLNSLLYAPMFVQSMKPKALDKAKRFPGILAVDLIKSARTIQEMDRYVTAKLHGFDDDVDYYQTNSAKPWLTLIKVPTFVINAKNDPFVPSVVLPTNDEVSQSVTLSYTETGGHVGFVHGAFPGTIDWLPKRLIQFFEG